MLQLLQSNNASVSNEIGFLNRNWKTIRFFFEKRTFESRLESVLKAAAGHEANSLPVGHYQYQVLADEGESLCTAFAERWSLDADLLRARIPGLAKLEDLSTQRATLNYSRLVCLGIVVIPLLFFFIGVVVGLVNVGFHFVGGR